VDDAFRSWCTALAQRIRSQVQVVCVPGVPMITKIFRGYAQASLSSFDLLLDLYMGNKQAVCSSEGRKSNLSTLRTVTTLTDTLIPQTCCPLSFHSGKRSDSFPHPADVPLTWLFFSQFLGYNATVRPSYSGSYHPVNLRYLRRMRDEEGRHRHLVLSPQSELAPNWGILRPRRFPILSRYAHTHRSNTIFRRVLRSRLKTPWWSIYACTSRSSNLLLLFRSTGRRFLPDDLQLCQFR
jgi:hypothetical protein